MNLTESAMVCAAHYSTVSCACCECPLYRTECGWMSRQHIARLITAQAAVVEAAEKYRATCKAKCWGEASCVHQGVCEALDAMKEER